MEYLSGINYDSNILCKKGKILFQSVKTRDKVVNGTITRGKIVDSPEIFKFNKEIAKAMNTTGYIMVQYIGTKMIELNPRWSTSVNYKNFNEYLMSIELALYGEIKQDIGRYEDYVGTEFYRFFDTISYNENDEGLD